MSNNSYRYTEPIEMPRGKKYGSNYNVFQSPKLNRRVATFSNLEFYHCLKLEMNPDVEYYCEQPARLSTYVDGAGGVVHFVPDVYVVMRDGKEYFVEVKYRSELQKDDTKRQIVAESKYSRENGLLYKLSTEKEILSSNFIAESRLQMVEYVNRYRYEFDDYVFDRLLLFLIHNQHVTVEALIENGIVDLSKALALVSVSIFNGIVTVTEKGRPFDLKTEVVAR